MSLIWERACLPRSLFAAPRALSAFLFKQQCFAKAVFVLSLPVRVGIALAACLNLGEDLSPYSTSAYGIRDGHWIALRTRSHATWLNAENQFRASVSNFCEDLAGPVLGNMTPVLVTWDRLPRRQGLLTAQYG